MPGYSFDRILLPGSINRLRRLLLFSPKGRVDSLALNHHADEGNERSEIDDDANNQRRKLMGEGRTQSGAGIGEIWNEEGAENATNRVVVGQQGDRDSIKAL